MNTSLKCILLYGIYVFAQSPQAAPKPGGTTYTNPKGSDEVTATVNGEATKDPENYELVPLESPVKDKKEIKSLEQFARESKADGLEPLATLAFFGKAKALLTAPAPVLHATESLLLESVAAGNPQTVQAFGGSVEDSDEEKTEEKSDEDKNSKKSEQPDTSEKPAK